MSLLKDSVAVFMQDSPFCVTSSMTVFEVAKAMKAENIGTVIVANDKQLEGIVTDRDIVTKAIALGKNPEETCIAEVMTLDPETVNQKSNCKEVLDKMADCGLRRLPVVDDNEELVGIISLSDLSSFIESNRTDMADILSVLSSDVRA